MRQTHPLIPSLEREGKPSKARRDKYVSRSGASGNCTYRDFSGKNSAMRLLHTSDWHLGKKLDRFDRLDEQKQVMEEICAIADREKVDAVLVAGDLFDVVNPPAEAVDLLYKTLKQLAAEGTRPVIAIAGNHDMPERIEAPDPLARECGIIFSGFPHSIITPFSLKTGLQVARSDTGFVELVCPNWKTPLRIVCAPYANEYRMRRCRRI